MSFDATEESLQTCFAEFGEISMCKMVRDFDTGRPRGTAFVQFKARGETDACLSRAANAALVCACSGSTCRAIKKHACRKLTRVVGALQYHVNFGHGFGVLCLLPCLVGGTVVTHGRRRLCVDGTMVYCTAPVDLAY